MQLDAVQLATFVEPELTTKIKGASVIKELIINQNFKLTGYSSMMEELQEVVDYFLLNFLDINWEQLSKDSSTCDYLKLLAQKYKLIIMINCTATELPLMIKSIAPFGIAMEGGEEEKVGVKSFDDLDECFEVLEDLAHA